MRIESREQLADLLRDAEAAHAKAGHSADGWPEWYATYIMGRLEAADAPIHKLLSQSYDGMTDVEYPAGSYASLYPRINWNEVSK